MARVLICDDSAFMRLILKRILTDNGHDVIAEASDGTMAVMLARQHKPDLITMDITMPQMNGIEAAKCIHAEDPAVPIVMVSALGQRDLITEAAQAGAVDFIVKPFEAGQVLHTLARVLAASSDKDA